MSLYLLAGHLHLDTPTIILDKLESKKNLYLVDFVTFHHKSFDIAVVGEGHAILVYIGLFGRNEIRTVELYFFPNCLWVVDQRICVPSLVLSPLSSKQSVHSYS